MFRHVGALWLAACALVEATLNPQCQHTDCQFIKTEMRDDYLTDVFGLYDQRGLVRVAAIDEEIYRAECFGTFLTDPAFPPLNTKMAYERVELISCGVPPGASYAEALQKLNVTVKEKLELLRQHGASVISAASFHGLPKSVKELKLSADDGPLVLEPGALAALDQIRKLVLWRVQADQMPRHLDQLEMWDTDVKVLPDEALHAAVLKIKEPELTSIIGSAPHLRSLTLEQTSALKTLRLDISKPELLQDSLLKECPALEELELRHIPVLRLPATLLHGAPGLSLKLFTFIFGNITTLPQNFFTQSKGLLLIDFSENKLESLPKDVFSGLSELLVLSIQNNRLHASDLRAVRHLTALEVLALAGNPLGDLCPEGNVISSLHQLEKLELARTNATRVCFDALRDLHALRYLDLRHNEVKSVGCEHFREISEHGVNTVVDLRRNLLEGLECSFDHSLEIKNTEKVTLAIDSGEQCRCDCPFLECIVAEPDAPLPMIVRTDDVSVLPTRVGVKGTNTSSFRTRVIESSAFAADQGALSQQDAPTSSTKHKRHVLPDQDVPTRSKLLHRHARTRTVESYQYAPTRAVERYRYAPTRTVESYRYAPTCTVESYQYAPTRAERYLHVAAHTVKSYRYAPTRAVERYRYAPTHTVESCRYSPTRAERYLHAPTRTVESYRYAPTHTLEHYQHAPTHTVKSYRYAPTRAERYLHAPTRNVKNCRYAPTHAVERYRYAPTRTVESCRYAPTRAERYLHAPTRTVRRYLYTPTSTVERYRHARSSAASPSLFEKICKTWLCEHPPPRG